MEALLFFLFNILAIIISLVIHSSTILETESTLQPHFIRWPSYSSLIVAFLLFLKQQGNLLNSVFNNTNHTALKTECSLSILVGKNRRIFIIFLEVHYCICLGSCHLFEGSVVFVVITLREWKSHSNNDNFCSCTWRGSWREFQFELALRQIPQSMNC